jgi:hypothetical protein
MILHHNDVNDIGLKLEGWPLSPFLNTGATIAVFQSDEILLWLIDAWNVNVSAGVISLAVSFSRRPGILSGPVALCGFSRFLGVSILQLLIIYHIYDYDMLTLSQ